MTLLLAAREVARKDTQVRLRPELNLPTPRFLKSMAEIEFSIGATGRLMVSAMIDTGKMKWDLDGGEAVAASFEDYADVMRRGVDLGCLPVLSNENLLVTRAPMKTPEGAPVTCWFAELLQEMVAFDGYELLALAQKAMQSVAPAKTAGDAFVTVPAQDLKYQAPVGGVDVPDYPDTVVVQRFAAALDEHGARVMAETLMDVGAVPTDLPPTYRFGSRGPVLVWFTESDCPTPFSIMYTTADGWINEEDDIDLDAVVLPF